MDVMPSEGFKIKRKVMTAEITSSLDRHGF